MTFLNPGLLYLLPLALIPIIIHLLNRLRYKRVQWAAMEFLLASRKETVKRSRLKNLLLLAARVLGVVLLVMAVARPVATGGLLSSVFVGGTGQRIILLDNSLSMSFVNRGVSNLERATECLGIIIGASARSERVKIAALLRPGKDMVYVSGEELSPGMLETMAAQTDAALDVRAALKSVGREIELTGSGSAEVVLITDLQRSNWHPEDVTVWTEVRDELMKLGEGFSLRVVDVGSREWRNASVADLSMSEFIFVPGKRTSIRAGLGRSDDGPDSSVVSFYLGEQRQSTTEVEWSGKDATASCTFEMDIPDLPTSGRIEIGEDKLAADNRRYFVIDPCREIPVLCVDGRPAAGSFGGASGFIAIAFSPEAGSDLVPNPVRPTVKSVRDGSNAVLGAFSAVAMASVAAPASEFLKEAHTYVERGGMLMVFLGEGADPAAYAQGADLGLLPAKPVTVSSAEKEEGVPIASIDYGAAALEKFDSPDNPQLHDVRVWRWWKLDVQEREGVRVLLSLENGAPWLVEQRLGAGVVLLFASPCDATWSTMPVSTSFLPLMHRLLMTFIGGRIPENVRTTGEPIGPSRRLSGSDGFEVTSPDGTTALYKIGGGETLFRDTMRAGIYRVKLLPDGPEERYAVNPAFSESSGERIQEEEIRGLLRDIPVTVVRTDDQERGLAGSHEGWPLAVLGVLILLLAELVIARSIDRA
ncbi:BatA domain-containing protein [Planctomycetota bacterium]